MLSGGKRFSVTSGQLGSDPNIISNKISDKRFEITSQSLDDPLHALPLTKYFTGEKKTQGDSGEADFSFHLRGFLEQGEYRPSKGLWPSPNTRRCQPGDQINTRKERRQEGEWALVILLHHRNNPIPRPA